MAAAARGRRAPAPLARTRSSTGCAHAPGAVPAGLDAAHARRAALRGRARRTTTCSSGSRQDQEDGVGLACVSLSSPLGIENLVRPEAGALMAAWHEGARALPGHFRAWASVPTVDPDLDELAALLARVRRRAAAGHRPAVAGRVGTRRPTLLRVAEPAGKPVFVHPGRSWSRAARRPAARTWWAPVVGYPAQLQAAWWGWQAVAWPRALPVAAGALRRRCRAGPGAPRAARRAGGEPPTIDPDVFVDTSSYGPQALDALVRVLGIDVLALGSDRPYADPLAGCSATPATPCHRGSRTRRGCSRRETTQAPERRRDGHGPEPAEPDADDAARAPRGGVRARRGRLTLGRPAGPRPRRRGAARAGRHRRERPGSWAHLVGFDDDERVYASLHRDAHVDVWLLCWTPQNDTGWHDHDISSGAVAVVAGELAENNLTIATGGVETRVGAGKAFSFGPEHIHRLNGAAPRIGLGARVQPSAVADGPVRRQRRRGAAPGVGLLRRRAAPARLT